MIQENFCKPSVSIPYLIFRKFGNANRLKQELREQIQIVFPNFEIMYAWFDVINMRNSVLF